MLIDSFTRAKFAFWIEVKRGPVVANSNAHDFRAAMFVCCLTAVLGGKITSVAVLDASAQTPSTDQSATKPKPAVQKPVVSANASSSPESTAEPKAAAASTLPRPRKPKAASEAKGPYYVDFRSRTAASYGHACVWF